MVGFLGFSSASAAACTLLAPEWVTTGGREEMFSGIECSDDAVDADAAGEPPDLPAALAGLLLVGAAMFQVTACFLACGYRLRRIVGRKLGNLLDYSLETQVSRGQEAQGGVIE